LIDTEHHNEEEAVLRGAMEEEEEEREEVSNDGLPLLFTIITPLRADTAL
jgi:hypothetical protein